MVRPYDVGCSNVLNHEKLIITLYNVCAVPWGVCSTVGCSVPWGDTMSTVGGYLEYRGGYHDKCGGYH